MEAFNSPMPLLERLHVKLPRVNFHCPPPRRQPPVSLRGPSRQHLSPQRERRLRAQLNGKHSRCRWVQLARTQRVPSGPALSDGVGRGLKYWQQNVQLCPAGRRAAKARGGTAARYFCPWLAGWLAGWKLGQEAATLHISLLREKEEILLF